MILILILIQISQEICSAIVVVKWTPIQLERTARAGHIPVSCYRDYLAATMRRTIPSLFLLTRGSWFYDATIARKTVPLVYLRLTPTRYTATLKAKIPKLPISFTSLVEKKKRKTSCNLTVNDNEMRVERYVFFFNPSTEDRLIDGFTRERFAHFACRSNAIYYMQLV